MEIILWRHAEAEDGVPGRVPDAARALTHRGQKQAKKMAKWLLERLPEERFRFWFKILLTVLALDMLRRGLMTLL